MPDSIETTWDPLNPEDAMAYFRQKVPVPIEVWNDLVSKNHDWAFKLAGIADMDVMSDVFDALNDSIDKGEDFRVFKERVTEGLENAWGGSVANPGARIATIFRTNLQSSYMAGHYQQAQEQRDDRPYVMLDGITDADQCEDCADINEEIGGRAIPLEEWAGEWPPYHHQCRDSVITLTADEAREEGILESMPDLSEYIDDDFNHVPGEEPLPEPNEYDDAISSYVAHFIGD